jgi:O-antigen biosynthesis protein WbqP
MNHWQPSNDARDGLKQTAKGIKVMLKRVMDLTILLVCMVIFAIPCLLIAIAIKLDSKGPVLFWSKRIGKMNTPFIMPKFRSMKIDAPVVATHLLVNPKEHLTNVGRMLRITSLDELPQLWSVAVGDMSFVGPRPALYSQQDLIDARSALGVDSLLPGITGWAQVNGRDEIPVEIKVHFDAEYIQKQSFYFDIKILWLTFLKVILREGVSH